MVFIKGHIQFNTGKTHFKKGMTPWNKGKKIPEMSGEKHPFYGKHHNEETREKISLSKKLQGLTKEKSSNWKGGKPKCKKCGCQLSNYGYKYCHKHDTRDYRKIGLKGARELYKRKPTSIEFKVYEKLKDMGIIFETQKIINKKFVVDAYIPSLNLIIEADGKYWHSLERIQKKDKAENAYLKKCGFNVLRLSEEEIKGGYFMERLVN
jgi:very-short-patch-repair endonuclease